MMMMSSLLLHGGRGVVVDALLLCRCQRGRHVFAIHAVCGGETRGDRDATRAAAVAVAVAECCRVSSSVLGCGRRRRRRRGRGRLWCHIERE